MTLVAGVKLGPYQIQSQLGAGGMGEVYRARDTRLARDVAVKVLPPAFADDKDRLHRFEQEACAAGALNHPNILSIYDVGTHDGAPYVVSELLEGETLREALDGHPLPPRKALAYATQIANGLSAAHDKGIIHRDLKPDNLFITHDERVKILDFGLAKLTQPSNEQTAQTDIATRKVHTDPGAVMGTAGYMSPEQVRGRAVDHRSDIFAFGAVLYEMLSGKRAFRGESAVETLNAILKEEPAELSGTNPNIAPALERVVWHCLEKSPERRFQSASDIAFALESLTGVTSHPSLITKPSGTVGRTWTRERMIWAGVCVVLLLALATLAFTHFSRREHASPTVRLSLPLPENATRPKRITISPDGSQVVLTANNAAGQRVLWVRPLGSLRAQELDGTEGAASPFWSPDGHFIGYFADQKLFKINASGGQPQLLCDAPEDGSGSWNRDGVILFAGLEGIYRIPAQGGRPVLATKLSPKEEAHRWPYFLPDGRHFVFLGDAETTEDHHIRLGSLDSQESEVLLNAISRIVYAAPGYLLYVTQGALVAREFDANTRKLTGDPITIAEHIAEVGGNHEFDFSVSEDGVLAYQTGDPNSQLTWFDRSGKKLSTVGEPRNYATVVLSPDERRAATTMLDSDGRIADVWLVDFARESLSRLTFESSAEGDPLWSPDGRRIVFSSNRVGNGEVDLYQKAAGGAGEDQMVFSSDSAKYPTSWSPDGKYILFENWSPKLKAGMWVLSLGDNQAKPLLESTVYDQFQGQLAPDGRFIAYTSNESGKWEIYVQPVPVNGEKWRISSNGGQLASWRKDGKELFYITAEGRLMSVDITSSPKFESTVPRQLFQTSIKNTQQGLCYAATADGQRFLVNTYVQESNEPMTVVLNWTNDLKR
ncbi:MAG TPA: protein kinase [Pyrinomonadaceae bacterium]